LRATFGVSQLAKVSHLPLPHLEHHEGRR
jgi:hypothetical protein